MQLQVGTDVEIAVSAGEQDRIAVAAVEHVAPQFEQPGRISPLEKRLFIEVPQPLRIALAHRMERVRATFGSVEIAGVAQRRIEFQRPVQIREDTLGVREIVSLERAAVVGPVMVEETEVIPAFGIGRIGFRGTLHQRDRLVVPFPAETLERLLLQSPHLCRRAKSEQKKRQCKQ